MKKAIDGICLLFILMVIFPLAASGQESGASIVSIISLDGAGKPQRQGMGVWLGKDGKILTSASLLAQSVGGIIKTSSGDLHLIDRIVYWNVFQYLAVIQTDKKISPGQSTTAATGG